MVQPMQLEQVLVNLITNALDALSDLADHQREITIQTALLLDDGISLRVLDNGPGMKPEQIKKIFDPFFTTKSEGMGLGLAISKSIIDNHGGRADCGNQPTMRHDFFHSTSC